VLVCLAVGAELSFRQLLFGNYPWFSRFRHATHYAHPLSEDYWKLLVMFREDAEPPPLPHQLLGWTGRYFSGETYVHNDTHNLGNKRPVLLFGDSFSLCLWSDRCFQDFVNTDETLSKEYYLLNYGVVGYGLDQIVLLMEQALERYENPYVIFAFNTLDLDRAMLKTRFQLKPHFELTAGNLKLHTPPQVNIFQYIEAQPPEITSYLARLVTQRQFFPKTIRDKLIGKNNQRKHTRKLSKKILDRGINELRRRALDFTVLVFHPDWPGIATIDSENWRDRFLRKYFDSRGVDYIWSRELINEHAKTSGMAITEYIQLGDGHPKPVYNRLVAEQIIAKLTKNKAKIQ